MEFAQKPETEEPKPIFRDLHADDDPEVSQIESLCMNCHENGITRLLLTKIPHYKEIIVMSFSCEHCGFENNEIQSGATVHPERVRWLLAVKTPADLNRQVVKSDYTCVKILEYGFEIPARSQKGEITTVEGILTRSIAGLQQDQEQRKIDHPEDADKIDLFIKTLQDLKELKTPFTLVLEDISGNCFIENPNAPQKDRGCIVNYYKRSKEENEELGISEEICEKPEPPKRREDPQQLLQRLKENDFTLDDLHSEVMQFPTDCPSCTSRCVTNMKLTKVPHFKEVVIMATNCEVCGHRTNEVKPGGGIEPRGCRMEVDIDGPSDFSRDVLKSDTCHLSIPQLDLEVGPHALSGRFTTVEGLLVAMKEQLSDPNQAHLYGDSQTGEMQRQFQRFFDRFDQILQGRWGRVTLVLDDPAGNSYIQSLSKDDEVPDDRLRITWYTRTYEQDDELGLNDIKTENY